MSRRQRDGMRKAMRWRRLTRAVGLPLIRNRPFNQVNPFHSFCLEEMAHSRHLTSRPVRMLASSSPARYPISTPVAQVLPEQKQLIRNALAGRGGSKIEITAQGHIVSATEPVWSKNRKPIGVIYVQVTSIPFGGNILSFIGFWLATGLFWLLLTAPVGALFGVLTTRGLVQRLLRLVNATHSSPMVTTRSGFR